jgi:3-dehydroquinate synthase
MRELTVGLGSRSYPIFIAEGCLGRIGTDLAERRVGKRYGLIMDDRVAEVYGELVTESLHGAGLAVETLVFPHGEASKSLHSVADLAGRLASLGIDRQDALIALGGGVTGDLAGFLAATYMRGIPYVQVPTTLLAQVDSSVGGKTGVDIIEGKNLIGVFHQPRAVYVDIAVLRTLPREELLGGLAEVIKYGVIRDGAFFDFLENHRQAILDLQPEVITHTISTCCRIKAEVVAEDEREGGMRRILNYGHTIGHAVEGASDFTIIHGLAVAIGMVAAARLAVAQGLLSEPDKERIVTLLKAYGLPVAVPGALSRTRIKRYLLTDKKAVGGRLHFVLPTTIGRTCIDADISEAQIDAVLG